MKKTGPLLYTMFFFLQKVFCSTKIQKNNRKTNCKLFILSFFLSFFHAVGASPFLFPHHQLARQRYNLLAFIPHPR